MRELQVLKPRYTASVVLRNVTGGTLRVAPMEQAVVLKLTPFFSVPPVTADLVAYYILAKS